MAREENELDPSYNGHENDEDLERFSGIPSSPPIAIGVFAALLLVGIASVIWMQMPKSADRHEEAALGGAVKLGTNGVFDVSGATNTVKAVEDAYSRRLVFTDGKKIVRHPNGLIEVPSVFSCEGAGIEPFWAYGANPERESAKELKAREEWAALCKEAQRQRPAR